nr:hypothetical protein [Tanacetum cinerariifolium]
MSTPKFAETHNLVAFFAKPADCEGFEQIIDFLNASYVKYALMVNPIVYTLCIKQLWDTAKVKNVNGEAQIQALVDKKKVIITEASIRRYLRHNAIFVVSSHTKKVFANMKRDGKDFFGKVTPLFQSMMVQAPKDMGKGSEIPTDPYHIPIVTQPSSSLSPKKQKSRRKQRKEIEFLHQVLREWNDQEDASKQRRMIDNIDQDVEITLVNDNQGRMNEKDMFGVNDLDGDEVVIDVSSSEKVKQSVKVIKKEVSTADPVTTTGEVVTAAGKGKIVEPERPLKRKDQIMINEKVAKNLKAQLQAELKEEERLARLKEEETNIDLVAKWDNTQAMMDADCELATRLQEEEREELSIKEKSRLFVELMDKRKKHFIEAFVPMDTEKIAEGSNKAVEGSEKAKKVERKQQKEVRKHKKEVLKEQQEKC